MLFIAQVHGVRLSFGATVVRGADRAVAARGGGGDPLRGVGAMLAVLDAAVGRDDDGDVRDALGAGLVPR